MSISHGTLNPRDLIPTFLEAVPMRLGILRGDAFFKGDKEFKRLLLEYEEHSSQPDWFMSEECSNYFAELMKLMQDVAPHRHIFASYPGDSSDFGWWPSYIFCDNIDAHRTGMNDYHCIACGWSSEQVKQYQGD